jgi:hypothetical protein
VIIARQGKGKGKEKNKEIYQVSLEHRKRKKMAFSCNYEEGRGKETFFRQEKKGQFKGDEKRTRRRKDGIVY